jgi:hypothetical protein
VTPASTPARERESGGNAGNRPATLRNDIVPQRILKIARDLFLLGEVLSNPDKLRHIRAFAQ